MLGEIARDNLRDGLFSYPRHPSMLFQFIEFIEFAQYFLHRDRIDPLRGVLLQCDHRGLAQMLEKELILFQ